MLAEASQILPLLLLWPWLRLGAPVPLPVGAGGWAARSCLGRPARRLRLQPAPAQAWEMVFFSLCVAAGTIYNRKKRERERGMTRPAGWRK